jgi:hypothetical protein
MRSGGPSTALAIIEMRKAIVERVDVIQNFIDAANGKMPEKWNKALNVPDSVTGLVEQPVRLTLEHIINANRILLNRILPEFLIAARRLARQSCQPSIEPTSRGTECPAQPSRRPDPPVLRDEGELHIDSFAK